MKIIRTPESPRSNFHEVPEQARYVWKILVVDDEPDVRNLTHLNLKNFNFASRELQILEADSAAQAREILSLHRDVAVALIDVVMETDDAGLRLVEYIRNDLGNRNMRLIIRTGQPGAAPERFVIDHFDIDDYKDKTELTAQRLYTTVRSAIKSYRDLLTIDLNRRGLTRVLDATPDIYRISATSLQDFFQGILTQIIGLCRLDEVCFIGGIEGVIATFDRHDVEIQASSDAFSDQGRIEEIRGLCVQTALQGYPVSGLRKNSLVLPLMVEQKPVGFIYIEPTDDLSESDIGLIKMVANQCSGALENLRLHINLRESYDHAIDMLAEIAEFRDTTTGRHINRVDAYTRLVAIELGVDPIEAERYGRASRLHDVGKVAIPDHILCKNGKLTPDEFAIIKRHAAIGASILRHDDSFMLAREIALSHHERWDGKGYPEGRPASELPLHVRIVTVVDAFDALVSRRPYKEPWSIEDVIAEIDRGAGTQFDPVVAQALLALQSRGELDALVADARSESDSPTSPWL
jgi:response regulator RpfG family c-di-GMP phosphodiesterase